MVGVRLRDLRALGRWFAGLGPRTRLLLIVAAVAFAVFVAWAVLNARQEARLVSADPDATPAALASWGAARGRGVYLAHCAVCHGPDGQGHSDWGAPNLADQDWLYGQGDVSDIEAVVLYGVRAPNSHTWRLADMPAYARAIPYAREPLIKPLTPDDIRDLIQFLHVAQGKSADGAAAARGAAIFAGRGGCYDCHGHDAHGDPAIGAPNLTDAIWLYGDGSDGAIFRTIAQGRAGVCPAWVGRLSAAQIREVSLYIHALSHDPAQPKPSLP
jgi:cytochrome c oxidase cbb3-type subunit 3